MAERNSSVYYVASSNGSGSGQHLPLDRESLRSRLEDEQDLLDQRRRLEDKALKILVCFLYRSAYPIIPLQLHTNNLPVLPVRSMRRSLLHPLHLLPPRNPHHLPPGPHPPLRTPHKLALGTNSLDPFLSPTTPTPLHLRPHGQHRRKEYRKSTLQSPRHSIPEYGCCARRVDRRYLLDLCCYCGGS